MVVNKTRDNFNPRTPRGVRLFPRPRSQCNLHISIHAPREGCDCALPVRGGQSGGEFQSTHPARGATDWGIRCSKWTAYISIHAPREGCDPGLQGLATRADVFQSTHPARGATKAMEIGKQAFMISIHAPREGCDLPLFPRDRIARAISIHAPREGCDCCCQTQRAIDGVFQSTHPARGATCMRGRLKQRYLPFQSTHPARGATLQSVLETSLLLISIHAPREGCDRGGASRWSASGANFNPRTPRGVRPSASVPLELLLRFQSTHPARGATANFTKEQRVCLAQFAYLHKGKKAEHTKTNSPMLH